MRGYVSNKTEAHALQRKAVCLFFIIAAVIFAFSLCRISAKAAEKEEKFRAIAIVFDNSGTMYQSEAWCRAIYSMEVFVAMADETDEIGIYPMNDMTITEGGSTIYTSGSPLFLQGGSDVSVIRNIYTQNSERDTPIEAITDAYNGLLNMSGEDKWLIVLTDGNIFYENGAKLDDMEEDDEREKTVTKARLTEMLTEYNNSVNVLYLGIGEGATIPEVGGSLYHEVFSAPDSYQILDDLTEMSNIIYGRDEIVSSSNTLDFDLSMTELILFVQGDDIENLRLTDTDGNEVGVPVSICSPQYTNIPGAAMVNKLPDYYAGNAEDSSLSGEIVTYGAIPAGTYTIKYDGTARSEAVYYVPNVSIQFVLVDEEGNSVANLDEDELYAGTYHISYGLVDEDGNLTDSSLLGDRNFQVNYTIRSKDGNETGDVVTSDENGTVTFELTDGDSLEAGVVATYLSGYTVSTDSEMEWPFQIHIAYTPYDLDVNMEADAEYDVSEIEESEPIMVNLTHNGEALTPEEMDVTSLTINSADLDCSDWEISKDKENSRFLVTPRADLKDAGEYDITAVATTYDESGEIVQAQDSLNIELTKPPYNLGVDMETDPEYVISQMDEAEPIIVNVTRDGEALTPEEMALTTLTISNKDLDCSDWEISKDIENSRFLVIPKAEMEDAGRYQITAEVTTYDEVGDIVQAQDARRIQLKKHPDWYWLMVSWPFILLAIIIIVIVLNQKVLPRDLNAKIINFNINGDEYGPEQIALDLKDFNYDRRKKLLMISFPSYLIVGNYSLTFYLKACGKRINKSYNRGAIITSLYKEPEEFGNLSSYMIENKTFYKGQNFEDINVKEIPVGKTFTYSASAEDKNTSMTIEFTFI